MGEICLARNIASRHLNIAYRACVSRLASERARSLRTPLPAAAPPAPPLRAVRRSAAGRPRFIVLIQIQNDSTRL